MENQINDLLQFISDRNPNTRFEVINNSLSPSLKHFVIKDKKGNKGFGTDHNYHLAIEKAYSEYIERKTFQKLHQIFGHFKTSNGFAAHIHSKNAKESSVNELIERDALLLTWHSHTAPYWLTQTEVKSLIHSENFEICSKHKKLGLTLNLGIVATHKKKLTCIVKVDGNFKGKDFFYIDTKTGANLAELLNTLIESISFYSHFIGQDHLEKNTHRTNILKEPMDHFYYYLYNSIDVKWFHSGSSRVMEIPTNEIRTYIIKPNEILGGEHLKRTVSFSESFYMQPYYCGNFKEKNINVERFRQFFDFKLKFNTHPHPLS